MCRWRKPWATPPMGMAIPGRPSPMRDAGWWPECRDGPTGSTFPRMTLSSTWPRAVAPVRRDRLPTPSCRRESGRVAQGGSTACRPSSSTGPNVGHVHCGPSASQPRGAGGGGCWSIPRKPCCSRPERCSKALTMTNIECAEVVVEHRLARLVQLGIRQSRYFGRVKTRFQLYLAATVANLTLVAGKLGRSGRTGGGATGRSVVFNIVPFVVAHAAANFCGVRLGQLWSVILLTSALLPKSPYPTPFGTFRPGF